MTEITWHQPELEIPKPDTPESRACSKCGETRPIDEFALRTDQPGKRRGVCRECRNARQRALPRTDEVKAKARDRATAYRQTDAYKESRPEIRRRHLEKRKAEGPTIARESKLCLRCGETKPAAEFHSNSSAADGLSSYCGPCFCEIQADYRLRNPERVRLTNRSVKLKRSYGITVAEFDAMLAEQGGGCAICGSTVANGRWDSLHVDHHHACGSIRGLLDNLCNSSLGIFDDDPDLLIKAAEYLERFAEVGAADV